MSQAQIQPQTQLDQPPPLSQTKPLSDLRDYVFYIKKIWIGRHEKYGEYAVVEAFGVGWSQDDVCIDEFSGYYRTFSKHVLAVLKNLQNELKNGKVLRCQMGYEQIYENARRTRFHYEYHLFPDIIDESEALREVEERKNRYTWKRFCWEIRRG